MKKLSKNQKRMILKNSNKIGTIVFFGSYEGKILSITQTIFDEVFLTLSYNTTTGIKTTILSTDNVNII